MAEHTFLRDLGDGGIALGFWGLGSGCLGEEVVYRGVFGEMMVVQQEETVRMVIRFSRIEYENSNLQAISLTDVWDTIHCSESHPFRVKLINASGSYLKTPSMS
jgi:hypothetical protein